MTTQGAFGRAQESHLSSETLDLLSLSALAEVESEKAHAHIGACDTCRARFSELEEDKQRFAQFVFPRTLPKIEEKLRPVPLWERMRQKWTLALPFAGLVAATAVLLVVVPFGTQQVEQPYYGIKGGARMDLVALRGDRQISVGNDTSLAPRDRIRFLVDPAGASYVIVASRDGQGNVTLYYPYEGQVSAQLRPGFQELPGSIELDAVPGRERLFAVFSDVPLHAEDVRQTITVGEDLRKLPGVREVVSKEFVKEVP